MPGGRVTIRALTYQEARSHRRFSAIGWAVGIIVIVWLVWWVSQTTPSITAIKHQLLLPPAQQNPLILHPPPHTPLFIGWPILASVLAPFVGWLFGWKWGIEPFFTGHTTLSEPTSPTSPST